MQIYKGLLVYFNMLITSELCGLELSPYHHVRLIVTLFYRAANSNGNTHIGRYPSGKCGGTAFLLLIFDTFEIL